MTTATSEKEVFNAVNKEQGQLDNMNSHIMSQGRRADYKKRWESAEQVVK